MPGLDDRIRRGLEALAAGGEGSFEDVARRKGRARLRRRAQAATLVVAVLAGTTGGVVALTRAFGDLDHDRPAGRVEGSLIAFVSNRDGNDEIYTMREDGTGLRNLTRTSTDERHPVWSHDGTRIAFVTKLDRGHALEVMRADGFERTELFRVERHGIYAPAWSRDGRIAALLEIDELRIVHEGEVETIPLEGLIASSRPDWSRDGRYVAFTASRGGRPDVFAYDTLARKLIQLTDDRTEEHHPRWFRDELLYISGGVISGALPPDPYGADDYLFRMGDRVGWFDFPASTDAIAYTRWVPDDLTAEIVLDTASGATTIARGTLAAPILWSPDGEEVLFLRMGGTEDDVLDEIWTVDVRTGEETLLTQNPSRGSEPAWQPLPPAGPVTGPAPTSTPRLAERCGREPTLYGSAYVDVTGDDRGDGVALTHIHGCPWVVHVRGQDLALHLVEGPGETVGRFAALKQIDDRAGLEVVVEIETEDAAIGGLLTSVITWRNGKLEELEIDRRNRSGPSDLVLGEIQTDPRGIPDVRFRGIDCAGEPGKIVEGELIRNSDGSLLLRRRFYEAAHAAFREQPAATQWHELPDGVHRSALASEFPELQNEPFSSCPRA